MKTTHYYRSKITNLYNITHKKLIDFQIHMTYLERSNKMLTQQVNLKHPTS